MSATVPNYQIRSNTGFSRKPLLAHSLLVNSSPTPCPFPREFSIEEPDSFLKVSTYICRLNIKIMDEGFDLPVTFNGQALNGHLWADSVDEREMGHEILWCVEVPHDGNELQVLRFSEYPEGGFTEVERSPSLTTPLQDFIDIILRSRNND